jgi:hypothetical protein
MAGPWQARALFVALIIFVAAAGSTNAPGALATPAHAAPALDDDIVIPVVRGDTTFTVVISFLTAGPTDAATRARARAAYLERFGVDGAAVQQSSYVLQGYHWPKATADWSYNAAGKPANLAGEQPLIAAAAGTWNAADTPFRFTGGGSATTGTGACHGNADGHDTIGWAPQPGSVLAVTCAWYNGNIASEFDMEIDPDWAWTTTAASPGVDFQSVVLHELGHALGLGHSQEHAAVMFAAYQWGSIVHDLNQDDLSAIASVYGVAPGAAAPLGPKGSIALGLGANLLTWGGSDTPPALALASVMGYVREVYAMDTATGTWKRYIPGAPDYASNLDMLHSGNPYWIITSGVTTLVIEP